VSVARIRKKNNATVIDRRYKEEMFRGTFTAIVTPFRNGDVDFAALEKLVEAQVAAGITGLVAVGTTGESPTLTYDEKHEVIQRAIKIAKGRCKIIAGAGTNSTRDSIEATKFAEQAGVDGALLVAPYYNKPSQEGLFRHFKAIADSTKLPIMLYNIPGRCSVDIAPDTVIRLAETCRNIVSIKEASGSVERVGELRRRLPNEFTILSGDDSLTLPFMAVGAVGVVSVASNLFPTEVCALVRACESGDFKVAENLHREMFPLFKDLFIEPNPVPAKTALAWRGAMSAEVRLPLCEMTDANQTRLRKTIEAFEKAK
jgi:4-hydroxy-tetrahydrodipicolinate synthase